MMIPDIKSGFNVNEVNKGMTACQSVDITTILENLEEKLNVDTLYLFK